MALQFSARIRGIRTKYIFGTTLKKNEVSAVIYRDFLPAALAAGRYAASRPSVLRLARITQVTRTLQAISHNPA